MLTVYTCTHQCRSNVFCFEMSCNSHVLKKITHFAMYALQGSNITFAPKISKDQRVRGRFKRACQIVTRSIQTFYLTADQFYIHLGLLPLHTHPNSDLQFLSVKSFHSMATGFCFPVDHTALIKIQFTLFSQFVFIWRRGSSTMNALSSF